MPVRALKVINDMFGTNFPFDDYGTPELADDIIRNLEIIVLGRSGQAGVAKKVLKDFKLHDTVDVRAVVMDVAYQVQIGVAEELWRLALTELLAPIVKKHGATRGPSFDTWVPC